MVQLGLRWFVPFVFVAGLVAEASIYGFGWAEHPIRSDGVSYYLYLPSVVLHHSPRLDGVANDMFGGHIPDYTGILEWPNTSWWLNPHPIGVAILMLPFFLIAHVLTLWSNLPPDGFSRYYQMAAATSGLFYGAVGLYLLQTLLTRIVSAAVALATIVSIAFGTNLFHYMTYDATYSHAYSFCLLSALLLLTALWYEQPTRGRSILLGAASGLIVLIRHPNAVLLLVPTLYGIERSGFASRVAFLRQHSGAVSLGLGVGALVVFPQVLLYRAISGSWFVYGAYQLYSGTLDLQHPKWIAVLFSVQTGLFFWSPLLLLAGLGYAVMGRPLSAFRLPSMLVVAILTWLIASWFHFGGSYGHRAYTDVLPLFALGIAAAYQWAAGRGAGLRWSVAAFATLAVSLSVVQMLQYWWGIIPFNDTTWEQYRAAFLRLS